MQARRLHYELVQTCPAVAMAYPL